MNEQIQFRAVQKSDYPALQSIIRKTWHYDDFCSPKAANLLAKVFLTSCLANQTFTQVAIINDTPAGVIMGKNIAAHKCPFSLRFAAFRSLVALALSKEARTAAKIFGNVSEIDKDLLQEAPATYQAELAFFAISPHFRGKGLGKKLFEAFLQYLDSQKIENFYLFTDTSCNFPFYEHQGLMRRGEKKHVFNVKNQTASMSFFLYDNLGYAGEISSQT